ncbi:MAG: hypothetical protein AB1489_07605 [Acidobacteriota bacterium]
MHFLVMIGFALFVAIVFAGINSEISSPRSRVIYGLKVFASFIGIGLAIAWLFYLFPR